MNCNTIEVKKKICSLLASFRRERDKRKVQPKHQEVELDNSTTQHGLHLSLWIF
ncbi:unnamed protein product [Acanthoscelides obtectus]|uniref:Uncharacterized protein n=1 Tax=Acanthoscelides obtectus TaxID=200917 RepID=A0A9P0M8J9_ACAOB|nr:unnamed protein product [Acanthoscelides obtectus]CAK1680476.1 hypothetical protein AOBTE_LOCUS32685 [Acanthoscelides obtectus]